MMQLFFLQVEIRSLKERVSQSQGEGGGGGGGGEGDHTHNLEIVQKELAAHKEVVTELRAHLATKEAELQVCTCLSRVRMDFSQLTMLLLLP